jgi:nicotinate phosphoribosyltransferase
VFNVRKALDDEGFTSVKIMVSGGFNAKRIAEFEKMQVPVDVYAVGSSLFNDNINFTADIVMVDGQACSKVGRQLNVSERLTLVD